MGEVTVKVIAPPPQPPTRVTLEMDLDTARALKALTGLGLVHIRASADASAQRNGFAGMDEVALRLVEDGVWDRLEEALS